MQLVADVEATLTQLRDEADSDTQGPKVAADTQPNPLSQAADATTLAKAVAEPVQGLVMTGDDEDASQQQAEERPAVAEHDMLRSAASRFLLLGLADACKRCSQASPELSQALA